MNICCRLQNLKVVKDLIPKYRMLFSKVKNQKSLKIEDDIQERENLKYTRRDATKNLIEHMYFPDIKNQQLQDQLDKKIDKLNAEVGYDRDQKRIEFSETDAQNIKQISSSSRGKKATKTEDFQYHPTTQKDINPLILSIEVNDRLLFVYCKYMRLFGHGQILKLISQIELNFKNQDEIKEKLLKNYEDKLIKLKQINKNIHMKFKSKFLTKVETLEHPGMILLLDILNRKIKENEEEFSFAIYAINRLMHFGNFGPKITPEIFENLEKKLSKFDLIHFPPFLSLLSYHESFGKDSTVV